MRKNEKRNTLCEFLIIASYTYIGVIDLKPKIEKVGAKYKTSVYGFQETVKKILVVKQKLSKAFKKLQTYLLTFYKLIGFVSSWQWPVVFDQ